VQNITVYFSSVDTYLEGSHHLRAIEQSPGNKHVCIDECRVCFILPISNSRYLATGGTLELGTIYDWIRSVEAGCQLPHIILQVFLNSR
jgi:hypothetical protein